MRILYRWIELVALLICLLGFGSASVVSTYGEGAGQSDASRRASVVAGAFLKPSAISSGQLTRSDEQYLESLFGLFSGTAAT